MGVLPDDVVADLFLPEPPSANRYWRSIAIKGRVRVLLSKEARAYRKAVEGAVWEAAPAGLRKVFHGYPVSVSITWYRARKSGDLDNRIKQVLDALKGSVYTDDDQVEHIEAWRVDDPRYKGIGGVRVLVTASDNFSAEA